MSLIHHPHYHLLMSQHGRARAKARQIFTISPFNLQTPHFRWSKTKTMFTFQTFMLHSDVSVRSIHDPHVLLNKKHNLCDRQKLKTEPRSATSHAIAFLKNGVGICSLPSSLLTHLQPPRPPSSSRPQVNVLSLHRFIISVTTQQLWLVTETFFFSLP